MTVTRALTRSLVAELHSPRYRMHKYWARKPHNIVRAYIEHYTVPGEIVLDPFAGSGVTLSESLLTGRKSIAVDINPIASLITEATVLPVNSDQATAAFDKIRKHIEPEANRLFATMCEQCGIKAPVSHVAWSNVTKCSYCQEDILLGKTIKVGGKYQCQHCANLVYAPSRTISSERPVEIFYTCVSCMPRSEMRSKAPDNEDQQLLEDLSRKQTVSFVKASRMFRSNRTLVYDGMTVNSFFTDRNRHILCMIVEAIEEITDHQLKQLLTFTFTGCVAQASRLIPYRNALTTGGPAWTVSGFWVPALHLEMNAWNCFSNRFDKVMRGKKSIAIEQPQLSYKPCQSFDHMSKGGSALIVTQSSTNLHNLIPDESIDYVFTDPPYGDSVPYLEYSVLWSGWFGLVADYENEIVISNSLDRDKTLDNYRYLLSSTFRECFRVLKPDHWLSITFHNRYLDVWDALVSSVLEAGFEFANCTYQVPAVIPAKSQLSKAGSVIGDIILNFYKPRFLVREKVPHTKQEVQDIVVAEAEQIIAERGGRATTDEIIRGVVIVLLKERVTHISEHDIAFMLAQRFECKNSYWSFSALEQHLVGKYGQLPDAVANIIDQCFTEGNTDKKKVVAEVLSQLQNSRTPDLKVILDLYEGKLAAQQAESTWVQHRLAL